VLGTVAAEVVRSGLRCLATGWTESAEKETVTAEFDGDEEVIILISVRIIAIYWLCRCTMRIRHMM
jgi:hypothetical protein